MTDKLLNKQEIFKYCRLKFSISQILVVFPILGIGVNPNAGIGIQRSAFLASRPINLPSVASASSICSLHKWP